MSTRLLGRWCLPVGKWKHTCQPQLKGMLADADNSVWTNEPIRAGHASPSATFLDVGKEASKADSKWVERLAARFHNGVA